MHCIVYNYAAIIKTEFYLYCQHEIWTNSITADMIRWLFRGSSKMTTFTTFLHPAAKATVLGYYGMVLFKDSWKICLKGVFTAYRGTNSSILRAKWGKFEKWGNFVGPPQLQRAVWGLRWGFKIEVSVSWVRVKESAGNVKLDVVLCVWKSP